jgi:UDP-glucose:(heptosyl)LPS alpha-1,3-glucosyltransferase
MKIGLVRRGYSATGGAEKYLQRFASALVQEGHECVLFGTADWPADVWTFGERIILPGKSPRQFADALAMLPPSEFCDFLFSLERVWKCDAFRAGDGVHQAWLERRAPGEAKWKTWFRQLRPQHRDLLALEKSLFAKGGAGSVIANSRLVKREISAHFDYPAAKIHVVYNGVPLPPDSETLARWRTETRQRLGYGPQDYLVLFAGSGWERKGLRHAVRGVDAAARTGAKLLVAGRGKARECPASPNVRLLGPVAKLGEIMAAADVFLLPTLYDPFSNATLEAATFGLPVITTADNGFAELIKNGVHGEVLANAFDEPAIGRALEFWSEPFRRESAKPSLAALTASFTMEANLRGTLRALGL